MDISLDQFVLAYRKAKHEVYYENNPFLKEKFIKYEQNLFANLEKLRYSLLHDQDKLLRSKAFLGSYKWILKKISQPKDTTGNVDKLIYRSNRIKSWSKDHHDINIDYRLVSNLSIDFHVLGSLWIDTMGQKLETIVGENSYGCRLKRPNQTPFTFIPEFKTAEEIKPSLYQKGHFRFYPNDYRRWQYDGLEAMREALKKKKDIIAITTDVERFYHNVDVSYLAEYAFHDEIDYNLLGITNEDIFINNFIVEAVKQWSNSIIISEKSSLRGENQHFGIPVGWAASKVIANIFLSKFDKEVKKGLMPLYYGRYVDDIFLVIENGMHETRNEFWQFITRRVDGLVYNNRDNIDPKLVFDHSWSPTSNISFGKEKERIFVLEGTSGETLIDKVQENLDENSSEWRLLPESEESIKSLEGEMTNSSSDFAESVNSLRKSDGISIQRLKFILLLKRYNTMVETFPRKIWENSLADFFKFCIDFIIIPENLPKYLQYHSQIMTLLIKAKMYSSATQMWNRIEECWRLINIQGNDVKSEEFIDFHFEILREAFVRGLDFTSNHFRKEQDNDLAELLTLFNYDFDYAMQLALNLFLIDMHSIPFKNVLKNRRIQSALAAKNTSNENLRNFSIDIPIDQFNEIVRFWKIVRRGIFKENATILNKTPSALIFSTRNLSLLEFTQLFPRWSTSSSRLKRVAKLAGGFGIELPVEIHDDSSNLIDLEVQHRNDNNPVFALTSYLVSEASWKALVRRDKIEPDESRITRLFDLVNSILKCKKRIDYVVFPELSIPENVITEIAYRLKQKNISLITGVEYDFSDTDKTNQKEREIQGFVSNHLRFFLTTSGGNMIQIIQEKALPAIHEESGLFEIGGLILQADQTEKYIIKHGKFIFSGLICNDLLNIDNRQPLRGNVDALIVVEWNQDTTMYDAMIKATSNDLHCFVIQVNNREYGDTRLRAPYKADWERDKVSVRGGELDYFVVATLEIDKLRQFQMHHRSPEKPFKPVPTGFIINEKRRSETFK